MKLNEKKNLIDKIGMQFNEAIELFSEETLQSMLMVNIVGGANAYCDGAQCVEGCNNNCKCGSSSTTWLGTAGTVVSIIATIVTIVKVFK